MPLGRCIRGDADQDHPRPLPDGIRDEKAAVEGVHAPFPVIRKMPRRGGRRTIQPSKVIMPILGGTAVHGQPAQNEPPWGVGGQGRAQGVSLGHARPPGGHAQLQQDAGGGGEHDGFGAGWEREE